MNESKTQGTQEIATRLATMTLAETLAMAQAFETSVAGFYRALAGRVPAKASPLAHELADGDDDLLAYARSRE